MKPFTSLLLTSAIVMIAALGLLATSASGAEAKAEKDVRRSVVRVHATQRVPNVLKPWLRQSPREVAGPGVAAGWRRPAPTRPSAGP